MKKLVIIILGVLFIIPFKVSATRGCCSSHGGVCGCSKTGVQMCCDGTGSPTCRCTPPAVYGCTDRNANNYNVDANKDDGSCTYTVPGCTDSSAKNYNASANQDDGSCQYDVPGCKDSTAKNYNPSATVDDGSCEYNKSKGAQVTEDINIPNTYKEDDENDYNDVLGGIGTVLSIPAAVGGYIAFKKAKKK